MAIRNQKSRGSSSRSNRRQNTPERDEEGRFMSDDRSSSGGRGRSSQNGDDYDNEESGRSRGRGGWFGDSEDHSQAARSGRGEYREMNVRGSGRYEQDDDNNRSYRDRSRNGHINEDYDDRSYRGRSRNDMDEGYDDRSQAGRSREHGGWFGDSEGHAEAARRGWSGGRNM
ncbi:MAG TPA: hypothetical protein VIF12_00055, partial [Micavibrio sp.]